MALVGEPTSVPSPPMLQAKAIPIGSAPDRPSVDGASAPATSPAASTASATGIMISAVEVLEIIIERIAALAMKASSSRARMGSGEAQDAEAEPPVQTDTLDRQRNERAAKDQEQDRRIIRAGGLLRVHDPRERQDEERHQRRCGEGERLGYPPGGHQDDQPRNDEPFARKTFGQRPENCREQCYYAQRKADRSRHIPLPRPVIGNRMERARGR